MEETRRKRNVGPNLSKMFLDLLKSRNITVKKRKRGLFLINDIPSILALNNNNNPKESFFWGISDEYLRNDEAELVILIGGRNFGNIDTKNIKTARDLTPDHQSFLETVNIEYAFIFEANWIWEHIKDYDPTSTKWQRRNFHIYFQNDFHMTLEKEKFTGNNVRENALNKYDKLRISGEDQEFLRSTIRPIDKKKGRIFLELAELRLRKERDDKIRKEYREVELKSLEKTTSIRSINELLDQVFAQFDFESTLLLQLRKNSDTELEHLVQSLLATIYEGYNCYITREKGRGHQPFGDILLTRDNPITDDEELIMVEVKGGTNPQSPRVIGSREIDLFVGKMVKNNISEGIFATNGVFSSRVQDDIETYRGRTIKIRLIDGEKLVTLLIDKIRQFPKGTSLSKE